MDGGRGDEAVSGQGDLLGVRMNRRQGDGSRGFGEDGRVEVGWNECQGGLRALIRTRALREKEKGRDVKGSSTLHDTYTASTVGDHFHTRSTLNLGVLVAYDLGIKIRQ